MPKVFSEPRTIDPGPAKHFDRWRVKRPGDGSQVPKRLSSSVRQKCPQMFGDIGDAVIHLNWDGALVRTDALSSLFTQTPNPDEQ